MELDCDCQRSAEKIVQIGLLPRNTANKLI